MFIEALEEEYSSARSAGLQPVYLISDQRLPDLLPLRENRNSRLEAYFP